MQIEFKYPFILLIFLPIAFLLYRYWKQTRTVTNRQERYLILFLRSCIFLLLIVALAIPQVVLPQKETPVVFVMDRSASVQDSGAQQLEWLEKSLQNKNEKDKYSVLSFGEKATIEQMMGKEGLRFPKWDEETGKDHTNIEGAINLASSVFSNNSGGRIVLFTDGNETMGNLTEAAKLLKNRSIELDTVLLDPHQYEDTAVTEVEVPSTLYEGEKAAVSVTIESNTAKTGLLHFYENNNKIISKMVDISEGTNIVPIEFTVEQAGLVTFKAEVELTNDAYAENNKLQVVNMVKTIPQILLVQNSPNEALVQALEAAGYKVEVRSSIQLPTVLSGYLNYQSIIFNNIAATDITENQMNLVEKSVKDFGIGFLMTGGENSFGLGGYFQTPIEKLLPVDMDIKGKKEMPSLALMIVLDRSGSMDGSKFSLAKEAAARSVELLQESDTLGFIAFDDKPWVIVEPKPLKNKEEVVDKIRSVPVGGGTEIYGSLVEAYDQISDLDVKRKHIILLTDGQSATNNNYEELINNGSKKNVTLSTVALGADADRNLLEELAEFGAGRFYDVQDSTVIPSILSRETVMATRTYIEDTPFYPQIKSGYGWDSLFNQGVPEMNAYIATSAKSESTVPIVSTKEDPILAEWQYGLGKTIAFTSDVNGAWAGDWARWNQWSNFITKMVANTLPQYDSEAYSLTVEKEKDRTYLSVSADQLSMLPIETTITSERGETIEGNTKMIAPGKYEVDIGNDPGLYFIHVKQTDEDGNISVYQSGFTIPYSDEYLITGINEEKMEELLAITGGIQLQKESQAFRPLKDPAKQKQEITEVLLFISFLLLFIEIAIRRFGLPVTLLVSLDKRRNVKDKKDSFVTKEKKEAAVVQKKDVQQQVPIREKRKKQEKPLKKAKVDKEKTESENHLDQLLEMKRKKKR
ncbi:VWA domain-containing protein [Niallia circulans]|uniref:VWA domain-containing protein n=1 Tax=Niallia circulans TaxID=1397 RepID=UPI001CFFBBAA|nr:VWA domain-containing protein [Niallia circulans]MCB5235334.1 VWA domain-containing protein [Niallia circulans]